MHRMPLVERRAALLDAAVRVIARRGLPAASVRVVTAEAGMPTASFHAVFDSRDAMLEQLVDTAVGDQEAGVAADLAPPADLADLVVGALDGWLDRAVADPDVEVVLHELLAWSRFTTGDPAASIYRR